MSYPQQLAANANISTALATIEAGSFGIASTVDNGVGDTTINLTEAIDATECSVVATIIGATPGMLAVEKVSDGVLRVRGLNAAGAAADLNFNLQVWRTRVGP